MAEQSSDNSPSPSGPERDEGERSFPIVQAVQLPGGGYAAAEPSHAAKGDPRWAGRRTSYMAVENGSVDGVGSGGSGGSGTGGLEDFAPYVHSHPRRNSITPDRQRRFIGHLAATGIVKQAALHIGASLEALYKLRARPGAEGFAEAWDRAVDAGMQRVEDAALERAIFGEERLVVSGGKVLGTERRYNESLVQFMLRNRRTERYVGTATKVGKSHPLYKQIREEVRREFVRERKRSQAEVLESLNRKLDLMRERKAAADRLLREDGLVVEKP